MNSGRDGFAAGLRLAFLMGRRDLRNRYAGSFAGAFWNLGVPILYSLVNVFVFSILMSGRMGVQYQDIPFALFYFSGFSVWSLFAEVTTRSTVVLREHAYLINKIAFPEWVIPLIPLAAALVTQLLVVSVVGGLCLVWGYSLSAHAWAFVPLWLLGILLTVGIAYAVAAISVFLPDMAQIVPVCVNILFFLTPMLYPSSLIRESAPEWVKTVLLECNPFFYLVEGARTALFGGYGFPWHYLAILGVVAALALSIGGALFLRLRKGFADVL